MFFFIQNIDHTVDHCWYFFFKKKVHKISVPSADDCFSLTNVPIFLILKQKVKEFGRMKEEKSENKDSIGSDLDPDDNDFMAWDEVRLLVENFVDLDDGMAEMMNRKLAAEKMIAM